MAIPKFNELFTDVLEVLSDGVPHQRRELFRDVVKRLNLTEAELAEKLKSGWNRAEDRAHWAAAYLFYAEAITKPTKGFMQITEMGRRLLANNPTGVTLDILKNTAGIIAWTKRGKDKDSGTINDPNKYSTDPRYIIDLAKRIVTISVKTLEIVAKLPDLKFA
jgi:restriction system protein